MNTFAPDLERVPVGFSTNLRGRIAINMAERFALIAAGPGGHDPAGRQQSKMQGPDDIARRACEVSDALVSELEARGWVRSVGLTPDEAAKEVARLNAIKRDISMGSFMERRSREKTSSATADA